MLRNRLDLHLYSQHLALIILKLIILKLGIIKVAVSNRSSKMNVIKLLRFGWHKILFFFAFCEKGPFLNLKYIHIPNKRPKNTRVLEQKQLARHSSKSSTDSVKALVRWATCKRLTNHLPKLSLITCLLYTSDAADE